MVIYDHMDSKCALPWASLMLTPYSIGPECELGSNFVFPNKNKRLFSIWNSDQFIELRKKHVSGQFPDKCKNCKIRSLGSMYYDQFEIKKVPQGAKNNFILNKNEYTEGKYFLESSPVTISADLLYECNFFCLLCTLRFKKDQVSDIHASDLLFCFATNAVHLHVSGGEPFMDHRFIKYLSSNIDIRPVLSITTNASLITDTILDKLRSFPAVNFHISIDSFNNDVFAKLRKGPFGLNDIISTIHKIKEYRDQTEYLKNRSQWFISIQSVWMSENILELPDYIVNAQKHKIDEIKVCRLDGDYPHHDPYIYLKSLSSNQRKTFFQDVKTTIAKYPMIEMDDLNELVSDLKSLFI